ncbi:hypothetical protein ACQ27_gp096 [Klebsiella phage K64-1]|nr:hypothetical protein ACQ27_gp096 [Klebsiella phage K64-1]
MVQLLIIKADCLIQEFIHGLHQLIQIK